MIITRQKAWKAWDPSQMTTHLWLDAKNGTYVTSYQNDDYYTLDLIYFFHGSWGFVEMDSVRIPGY